MTSGGGEPVSSNNPTNVFNSTMTSTASTSPERSGEDDGFVSTIRQLTEEKEDLAAQLESLSQQLDQERENGRNVRMRMEAERSELEEKLAVQDQQLQQQVSNPINIESLRQGEALARKMLAVRDGEVALLKAQLVSTEAKLDAAKERCTLQKTIVMEEVRKMALQLAEAEQLVSKWKETASKWAELDHAEDVKLIGMEDLKILGERLKHLLNDRKETSKELETLKETNLSLVKALAQHGSRLSSVSYQLDQTWAWLSKIKLEASRLQTDESVMRYELKEKRALLDDLKEQLEGSRKQWEKIRASNDANQSQWQSIRDELDCRKVEEGSSEEETEPAFTVVVPPIDLVSDIPSVTAAAAARDGREERLRLMEQQCRALYAKLANTTCRNAELVGRLATLHKQHSHYKEEEAVEQHPPEPVEGEQKEIEDQTSQVEDVLADKERQIISLREELQAVKFDLGTRQLEQEKNQQAYRRQEEELGSALDRLKENEDLIGNLQDQLYHLKSGSRDEKQSLDSQLRQLELALMTRNEECEGLVNELRSTVAELDQLRTQFKELDETVLELRMTESRLKGENQSLKDESVMLRHKIVQLVQEKDSLWKHSDKLLHLHRVQATDQWIADGSIRDCQGCQTKFTLFVRRHHCRLCGRIFCHNCSDHWLSIAASKRPERTCQECFSIHDQFSRPDAAEQLLSKPSLEDVTDQIPSAESTCAGFSVISDGEIVSSLNESSPYSVSPVHQSADGSVKKVIRTAGIRPFESLLLAGRAVSGADQEVGSAAAVPSEAFLSAAMVHRVPLLVDQPGCTLHWKFKSDPKSIAFAVVGKSDEEGNSILKEEEEFLDRVIVGTALHPSDEDFVVGSAVLPEPGTYYVYFDNSYSRFSANKVTFYLSLTLPC